jgi:hypothetical protein
MRINSNQNITNKDGIKSSESGSRGSFSPSPHNTPHAGPHGAFHSNGQTCGRVSPTLYPGRPKGYLPTTPFSVFGPSPESPGITPGVGLLWRLLTSAPSPWQVALTGFTHRGLAPHKFTPVPGVHNAINLTRNSSANFGVDSSQ